MGGRKSIEHILFPRPLSDDEIRKSMDFEADAKTVHTSPPCALLWGPGSYAQIEGRLRRRRAHYIGIRIPRWAVRIVRFFGLTTFERGM